MMSRLLPPLIAVLLFLSLTNGLIHHISVSDDTRSVFSLDTFGFFEGGLISLSVTGFKVGGETPSAAPKSAFVIKRTDTESSSFIEESDASKCLTDDEEQFDADFVLAPEMGKADFQKDQTIKDEGFYRVVFVNCEEGNSISFELELTMYNPGPNFLSAGLVPLPIMYFVYSLVYIAVFLVWVFYCMCGEGKLLSIHHLLTAVLVLKVLYLLFKGVEYQFMEATGQASDWVAAYYVVAVLSTISMFMVIGLIGSWVFTTKSPLFENHKKIFTVVLPLQIVTNVAMIFLRAPGSNEWFTSLLGLDIICWGALVASIFLPMRDPIQLDGKGHKIMEKLKVLRQFYLLVLAYVYFTTLVIYAMDSTLPLRWVWLGAFCAELYTLTFWCITCYKFRPVPDNPYFKELSDDTDKVPSSLLLN